MKIIVTGSLGNISKPLTQSLVRQGHEVVVISSNPEKQKDIEALNAAAAIGTLEDAGFLAKVFRGADAVYTMVPPDFAAPDPIAYYERIGKSFAKAIQQSGIRRVVQLSSWGAHLPEGTGFIVGSYRVEMILNGLKEVSITYLRPCSFYNNLYHYVDMIREAGFIGTNFGGDDKVVMVSATDITAAAQEELTTATPVNSIRYVASDERTCREIAAVLGAAIGKPGLEWITFTDEQVKEMMEKNGMPSPAAGNLVALNASIRSGALREDYDLHPPAKMGTVKLEDFAKEFAAAFK